MHTQTHTHTDTNIYTYIHIHDIIIHRLNTTVTGVCYVFSEQFKEKASILNKMAKQPCKEDAANGGGE